MRPIYETDQDRGREREVHSYLESKLDCVFKVADRLSNVDGFLCSVDGEMVAAVEIKTRRNPKAKYPTYMLSAAKWRNGLETGKIYGVPFVLIVKFTDGIYAVALSDRYKTSHGGRYDRGDARDAEECIYIPIDKFHEV
jgi:hypothetical protein